MEPEYAEPTEPTEPVYDARDDADLLNRPDAGFATNGKYQNQVLKNYELYTPPSKFMETSTVFLNPKIQQICATAFHLLAGFSSKFGRRGNPFDKDLTEPIGPTTRSQTAAAMARNDERVMCPYSGLMISPHMFYLEEHLYRDDTNGNMHSFKCNAFQWLEDMSFLIKQTGIMPPETLVGLATRTAELVLRRSWLHIPEAVRETYPYWFDPQWLEQEPFREFRMLEGFTYVVTPEMPTPAPTEDGSGTAPMPEPLPSTMPQCLERFPVGKTAPKVRNLFVTALVEVQLFRMKMVPKSVCEVPTGTVEVPLFVHDPGVVEGNVADGDDAMEEKPANNTPTTTQTMAVGGKRFALYENIWTEELTTLINDFGVIPHPRFMHTILSYWVDITRHTATLANPASSEEEMEIATKAMSSLTVM